MKYSTKYSDAIHILAYIEMLKGTDLSSDRIAQSVETNPAYVRRIMSDLRTAGLIESQRGKAEPKLLKKPEEITLLDIYSSVEKDQRLLHIDKKTNPNCLIGYERLQKKIELEMQQITLADIIDKLNVAAEK